MMLGQLLLRFPYSLVWKWKRRRGSLLPPSVYIAEPMDWIIWRSIQKHIQETLPVIAKKPARKYLQQEGIPFHPTPAFPREVIMCRHAAHRFPEKQIQKIGMNHGMYRFKRFTRTENFLAFSCYLFSCEMENRQALERGITNGLAVGSPKLDPLFNGSWGGTQLDALRANLGLSPDKKTLLMTATWDKSGLSAIHHWYRRLSELTGGYNVLVTVHPWVKNTYTRVLRNTPGVTFIEDPNLLPYMCLADVLIGDTSSLVGEFCALNKPIITFEVKTTNRLNPDIPNMLKSISWRIQHFDELESILTRAISNPDHHAQARSRLTGQLFDATDGLAGRRAAQAICRLIPELHLTTSRQKMQTEQQ